MSEIPQDNKISEDMTRRELLAACAQVAVSGAVIFAAIRYGGSGTTTNAAPMSTTALPKVPQPSTGASSTKNAVDIEQAEEYVQERLSRTSVNLILNSVPFFTIRSLKELRNAQILTVVQVPNAFTNDAIPSAEREALRRWYEELKQQYRADYYLSRNLKDVPYSPYAGWWYGLDFEALNQV